ncbi:MAG: VanW family protein [Patescibacteria group bacterium]
MAKAPSKKISRYLWEKWWQQTLTVFFGLVFVLFLVGQIYAAINAGKIYPGVKIGFFPVGGLTLGEAEQTLQAALDSVRSRGLLFSWQDRTVAVPAVVSSTDDPDLSYEIITYNIPETLNAAASFGRAGSWLNIWEERLRALFGQANLAPAYNWRQDKVVEVLRANLSPYENAGHDAAFVLQNNILSIVPEKSGQVFDYGAALGVAESQLSSLLFSPINLKMIAQEPQVLAVDLENILAPAQAWLLASGDITLTYKDKAYTWTRSQIMDLLEARQDRTALGGVRLGLSSPKLRALLEPVIAELNVLPQEPKFKLEGNKVVEFKPGLAGQELDMPATWEKWENGLFKNNQTAMELVLIEKQPEQNIADLNNLGIEELLGVGKSNFKGSPKNRRHNIAIGAAAVNGTLIPPGEEFSLLKTLGKIDGTTGYLPELVIKGNKTTPEFGGGLCQVGTTTFRGTLAAGLPVTERQNHSYAVTYYNNDKGQPGTDATIYDPRPDYKFKNDTANYVLIATRIEGDDLFFEYWGTKDGRQAEQSDVRVWDRMSPPPTKLVETLDLKPGEKKCTERPHAGMKAAFDYKISYPDGKVDARTFTSQYRPWQEVCLIGVKELTASSTAPTAVITN